MENLTPTKLFWRGKDVDELSREELIEALYQCHHLYEDSRKSHQITIDMWRIFSEARNTTISRTRR